MEIVDPQNVTFEEQHDPASGGCGGDLDVLGEDFGRGHEILSFCEKLSKVWMKCSDLRFGQLISNITDKGRHVDIFYTSDELMLEKLENFASYMKEEKIYWEEWRNNNA